MGLQVPVARWGDARYRRVSRARAAGGEHGVVLWIRLSGGWAGEGDVPVEGGAGECGVDAGDRGGAGRGGLRVAASWQGSARGRWDLDALAAQPADDGLA